MKELALKWLINFNPAKTEVILVSYIFHDYDSRLTYDDAVLNIVETHKHLGIYLSANNKCTKHIDSIIMSASKQVSYLRKVSKGAKIRNRYNQVPHLTQDTNGKVIKLTVDTTNESQEVSPFPAGDHKAHINRPAQRHNKHKTEKNP